MYDIQIKRIHEYKRQYLNILSLVHRYAAIKAASPEERAKFVPRVCMFGGKAASAYYMAKKIVRLINAVGAVVNADPEVGDLLKARAAAMLHLCNFSVLRGFAWCSACCGVCALIPCRPACTVSSLLPNVACSAPAARPRPLWHAPTSG